MGLYTYDNTAIPKSDRIPKLVENLYAKMPEIESARAKLITESYKQTENEPIIIRRAKAFEHILENIPIVIRDLELIVGSTTLAPRGCQTYPEFSYEWLEAEFDTVETRSADPFYISEQTKQEIKEADAYWKGKTTSELATAYMEPETLTAMEHNMFTQIGRADVCSSDLGITPLPLFEGDKAALTAALKAAGRKVTQAGYPEDHLDTLYSHKTVK